MLILLTDGRPTVGVTNNDEIRSRIKRAIRDRYSVFCLGFGGDVDHTFLSQVASENKGLSR